MADIITGLGPYAASVANCKVEVTEIRGRHAIGWAHENETDHPVVWTVEDGATINGWARFRITGPWVESPPSRHECWTNVYDFNDAGEAFATLQAADKSAGRLRKGPARHMVELREGECEPVPLEPTREQYEAVERGIIASHSRSVLRAIYQAMIKARPK